MKKTCLLILVGLIVICISATVIAEPNEPKGVRGLKAGKAFGGPRKGPGCRIGMILKMKEELGLSDTQVQQLEALKGEVKEQMKTGQEAVKAKREALQEAVKAGAEESAIRAAAAELGKALGDQAVLKVSTKAKIDGILTEDQKSKLKDLKGQCAQGKPKAGECTKDRKGPGMAARDPEGIFAKIDTDGNGVISLEEFKAHREQMRERFAGAGPGGPMGPGGPKGHWGQGGNWGRGPNYPVKPPED